MISGKSSGSNGAKAWVHLCIVVGWKYTGEEGLLQHCNFVVKRCAVLENGFQNKFRMGMKYYISDITVSCCMIYGKQNR